MKLLSTRRCGLISAGVALAAAATVATLAASTTAQAADVFPSRPVRMLVPFSPGGATDIVARHVAQRLGDLWAQPVIVDNRAGASGNIALEATMKAVPDGYTLFVGNVTTNAINETTFAQMLGKLKPSRDLVGITNLIEIPHVVGANPQLPVADVKQLVEYAKKNPGKLNYASAGIGSYPHLDMVLFARVIGIDATHIPYKGGAGQMVPSLIGNETQVAFVNLGSTIEHLRSGRLKALATTAPQRLPELPNVPTMAEQGFAGQGTNAWNGLFAPAALPRPLLDRLFADTVKVMTSSEMREILGRSLMQVSVSKSPEAYSAFVRGETEKWAKVIRENNIKIAE
ncbi:MAG: tripartite tricarboxylate transporter substrate binding protein [Proteobacteria bacterium]|nr:tripartite tricarboxylate transporter substrate binding protein [Burkholderiales bacterium]